MLSLGFFPTKEDINHLLENFNLRQFRRKQIDHCSGGTKRKLCAASAFVGNPKLVLLDEPTVGMDALSTIMFWKEIEHFTKKNCAVVVSHKPARIIFKETFNLEHESSTNEYIKHQIVLVSKENFYNFGKIEKELEPFFPEKIQHLDNTIKFLVDVEENYGDFIGFLSKLSETKIDYNISAYSSTGQNISINF